MAFFRLVSGRVTSVALKFGTEYRASVYLWRVELAAVREWPMGGSLAVLEVRVESAEVRLWQR